MMDLSNEVLATDFGQEDAKISEVKIEGKISADLTCASVVRVLIFSFKTQ